MVTTGLTVRLEAIAGKGQRARVVPRGRAAARRGRAADGRLVRDQRRETSSFAIVDVFPDEAGRQAHLEEPSPRPWAREPASCSPRPRVSSTVEVLAAKLP